MLGMPWEAMPWDAGLAILGVYRILRARKGRRLGGIRGTGTPAAGASTARRSRAASRTPTKEHPKIMTEFGSVFECQNAPKSL